VLDGDRIGNFLLRLIPPEHRARVASIGDRVHLQIGRYLRGQLLLIVLMSAVSWVVLHFLFQLRFALPVAILTGVLEVIPIVGPIAAAAVAASIALTTIDLQHAIWIVVAYTVLRQIEDQLVMPIVVGRAVELQPVVTLFAVLAGGSIAGLLGMLLAIPTAAAAKVVLEEWLREVESAPPTEQLRVQERAEAARELVALTSEEHEAPGDG
jgi:predicted PurR-regulated permease PerM